MRIDLNVLENAKPNIEKSPSNGKCVNCPNQELETPGHLLFTCERFKDMRSKCFDIMMANDPNFKPEIMNNYELLEYVLNLACPPECLVGCCRLVKGIYDARVKLMEET